MTELCLGGTDAVVVLNVGRCRRILAGEVGGFDERKAVRLAASLAPPPPPHAAVT